MLFSSQELIHSYYSEGEAATIIPNSAFRIPNLNKHLIVRIELVHNRHDEQDNHHQHQ